jgi:FkbM family methyltransferase
MNIRGYSFNIALQNWVWNSLESWDPDTFNWLDRNKGKELFWDVGAWIGPFTLYGSKIFSKVIAFEPDKVALRVLAAHVLNNQLSNVILENRGLYKENTEVSFGFIGGKFGDSLSSINHDNQAVKIQTLSIETAIELYGKPDFTKIDIEGGEEYLLEDLAKYKFETFCMSNHGPYMKDRKVFYQKLNDLILPLYDCYSIKNEKVTDIPDDGDFYYELKK